MKKVRKFSVSLVLTLILVMSLGMSVFASSSNNSRFNFAAPGLQFTMYPGQTQDITFFTDKDYSVFTTGNTSSKTAIGSSGKAGNNTATVYIGADEMSNRVIFYFYSKDENSNYETLIVDIKHVNFNKTTTSAIPGYTYNASTTDGTHTIIYDAQGCARAAFAIVGPNRSFLQVSLGNFVATANGIYLTVTTPYSVNATQISIPAADKAAAQALGVNGLILNGRTISWP